MNPDPSQIEASEEAASQELNDVEAVEEIIPASPNYHVFVLLSHLAAPVVWPWKRNQSYLVDAHGRAAFNHTISCILLFVIAKAGVWLLTVKMQLLPDGGAALIYMGILAFFLGFALFGMIKADTGVLIKYPLPFRWVRQIPANPALSVNDHRPVNFSENQTLDD